MKIALCGNPNVGKTTLFNRLTHSDAPVGNWHGVTVDTAVKRLSKDTLLVDLPGAYSLVARTNEERITVDNILSGEYDVIVYVAEVNNLRRNLYMLMQISEQDKPTVLVVNMMDEARGKIDLDMLSKRLGMPVIGTSQKDKNPKQRLLAAVEKARCTRPTKPVYLPVRAGCNGCTSACDEDRSACARYAYIDKLLDGVWERPSISKRTKKIDKVILGKMALPIFLAVMAAVFVITFEAGKPLSDLLVSLIASACAPVRGSAMPNWAISLLCDGVISGVGGVLAFLPQVVILFLLTAVLQDSGYMSRVAFVTDDFFKKVGLSGRAAFSLVLGLGCSATAVLSSRGIAGEDVRKRTAFATPFCPCSARLAVFTSISAYFGFSGLAVAAMYVLGFLSALIVLKILCVIGKKSDDGAMIMEMPPYRLPQVKRVISVVWRNVVSFVVRVGSVVLGVSVIMWILCNFSIGYGFVGGVENSIMQTFAGLLAPVFKPLGFGNWRAVAALLSGIAAKETVISVIATLGGMSVVFETGAAAMSFMVFSCLYVPCVATLSALAKENGVKSAALSVLVHTFVAYTVAAAVYGSALGYASNRTLCIAVWSGISSAVTLAVIVISVRARIKARAYKTA